MSLASNARLNGADLYCLETKNGFLCSSADKI